jgi:hypothetical protein
MVITITRAPSWYSRSEKDRSVQKNYRSVYQLQVNLRIYRLFESSIKMTSSSFRYSCKAMAPLMQTDDLKMALNKSINFA